MKVWTFHVLSGPHPPILWLGLGQCLLLLMFVFPSKCLQCLSIQNIHHKSWQASLFSASQSRKKKCWKYLFCIIPSFYNHIIISMNTHLPLHVSVMMLHILSIFKEIHWASPHHLPSHLDILHHAYLQAGWLGSWLEQSLDIQDLMISCTKDW